MWCLSFAGGTDISAYSMGARSEAQKRGIVWLGHQLGLTVIIEPETKRNFILPKVGHADEKLDGRVANTALCVRQVMKTNRGIGTQPTGNENGKINSQYL